VAYPIIIAPDYYRTFQKTDMTVKEHLLILLPSINASLMMSLLFFGIRAAMPAKMSRLLALSVMGPGGSFAYCAALFAFHQKRRPFHENNQGHSLVKEHLGSTAQESGAHQSMSAPENLILFQEILKPIESNNSRLPISPLKPMLHYLCEPTTKLIIGGT
jgi:hypothetical protein